MLFTCSSMESFLWGADIRDLLQHRSSPWATAPSRKISSNTYCHGLHIIQSISTCHCMVSSTCSRSSPSLTLVFAGLVLTLPFPKYIFPEAALALLVDTAVVGLVQSPQPFFTEATPADPSLLQLGHLQPMQYSRELIRGKKNQQKNHLPTHTTQNHKSTKEKSFTNASKCWVVSQSKISNST